MQKIKDSNDCMFVCLLMVLKFSKTKGSISTKVWDLFFQLRTSLTKTSKFYLILRPDEQLAIPFSISLDKCPFFGNKKVWLSVRGGELKGDLKNRKILRAHSWCGPGQWAFSWGPKEGTASQLLFDKHRIPIKNPSIESSVGEIFFFKYGRF